MTRSMSKATGALVPVSDLGVRREGVTPEPRGVRLAGSSSSMDSAPTTPPVTRPAVPPRPPVGFGLSHVLNWIPAFTLTLTWPRLHAPPGETSPSLEGRSGGLQVKTLNVS